MTQLTSTTEEMLHQEQNIQTSIEEAVLNYAKLAQESGLDGVVCSPLEAKLLTKSLGSDFLKVTPGIRPKGAAVNDQNVLQLGRRETIRFNSHCSGSSNNSK